MNDVQFSNKMREWADAAERLYEEDVNLGVPDVEYRKGYRNAARLAANSVRAHYLNVLKEDVDS